MLREREGGREREGVGRMRHKVKLRSKRAVFGTENVNTAKETIRAKTEVHNYM